VSWNEDGTAFIVKKVNEFSEHVLPKYFKHSNFASFVRQLNMYDFHKNRIENNENEFKHRLF
jgi:heat shock transcription factor 1